MNTQNEAASAASETCASNSSSRRTQTRRLKRERLRRREYALLSNRSPDGSYLGQRALLAMLDEWIANLRRGVRERTRAAALFLAQKHSGSNVLGRTFAVDPVALASRYPGWLSIRNWRTCLAKMCEAFYLVQLPRADAGDTHRDGSPNRYRFGPAYHALFARRHSNVARAKKRRECSFARNSSSNNRKKGSTPEGMHSGQLLAQAAFRSRAATIPSPVLTKVELGDTPADLAIERFAAIIGKRAAGKAAECSSPIVEATATGHEESAAGEAPVRSAAEIALARVRARAETVVERRGVAVADDRLNAILMRVGF